MAGVRKAAGPPRENLLTSRKIIRAEIITDRAEGIRRAKAFSPKVIMETAFAPVSKDRFFKIFQPVQVGNNPVFRSQHFPGYFSVPGFRREWSADGNPGEEHKRKGRERKVKWDLFS